MKLCSFAIISCLILCNCAKKEECRECPQCQLCPTMPNDVDILGKYTKDWVKLGVSDYKCLKRETK